MVVYNFFMYKKIINSFIVGGFRIWFLVRVICFLIDMLFLVKNGFLL